MTNRNLYADERDSRHAILAAVFQENRMLYAARSSLTMRPSRSVMRRDARADSAESCVTSTTAAIAPGQLIRQQDIFFRRQRGQQMVGLKNEADFAAAQQSHAVFI